MTGNRGVTIGLTALAAVAAVAVGLGAGALLTAQATPSSLREAAQIEEVPVTERDITDRRTVELALTVGGDTTLTSPTPGRLTGWTCAPGTELTSGRADLSVDGLRVLSLATSVPLWRDLAPGDSGEDVEALQAELARLGHPVAVDGTVDSSTLTAVASLFSAAGGPAPDAGTVPASRFLWLPTETVTTATCESGTGQRVAEGDPLSTLSGGLTGAAVVRVPGDLVAGERALEVDGLQVPADADGRVTSPEALATITSSPSYQQAVRGGETSMTGHLVLVDPITVSVVPPGALYDIEGQAGCVLSDGRPHPVEIVGSELGQTFVIFGGTVDSGPATHVALAPEEPPSCR